MRKYLLGIGAALLVFLVACQSESKEVIDFHNGYIDNVDAKLEEVDEQTEIIYNGDPSDEEAEEAADKLESLGNEMVEYLEDQDPEQEDTKEYKALRLEFAKLYKESIDLDVEWVRGVLEGSIDDNDVEELMNASYEKYEEASDKFDEAEEKLDELSDEYGLEEIEE